MASSQADMMSSNDTSVMKITACFLKFKSLFRDVPFQMPNRRSVTSRNCGTNGNSSRTDGPTCLLDRFMSDWKEMGTNASSECKQK